MNRKAEFFFFFFSFSGFRSNMRTRGVSFENKMYRATLGHRDKKNYHQTIFYSAPPLKHLQQQRKGIAISFFLFQVARESLFNRHVDKETCLRSWPGACRQRSTQVIVGSRTRGFGSNCFDTRSSRSCPSVSDSLLLLLLARFGLRIPCRVISEYLWTRLDHFSLNRLLLLLRHRRAA